MTANRPGVVMQRNRSLHDRAVAFPLQTTVQLIYYLTTHEASRLASPQE